MIDLTEEVLKRAAREVEEAKDKRGRSTLPPDDSEDMHRVHDKTKQALGLIDREDEILERLDSLDRDIRDIKLYLRTQDTRTEEWYDQ